MSDKDAGCRKGALEADGSGRYFGKNAHGKKRWGSRLRPTETAARQIEFKCGDRRLRRRWRQGFVGRTDDGAIGHCIFAIERNAPKPVSEFTSSL